MVKFLLDHDVPDDLSYLLEQLGHEVVLLRRALPERNHQIGQGCWPVELPESAA